MKPYDRKFSSKDGSVSIRKYLADAMRAEQVQASKTAISDLRSIVDKWYPGIDFQFGEIDYAFTKDFLRKVNSKRVSREP